MLRMYLYANSPYEDEESVHGNVVPRWGNKKRDL